MRVAHISDFHVLCLEAAVLPRLLNKRVTGYVNLRLHREHSHKPDVARAILADLRAHAFDHYVVTGDMSNLSLEAEFAEALKIWEETLGAPPERVTLVPGNHDSYTRGAERSRRFYRYFEHFLGSDLPELRASHPSGLFPVVKLREGVAFIGLSSSVARPPLIASGVLGSAQRDALARILAHEEVSARFPVVALHHPLHAVPSWFKQLTAGLEDREGLTRCLTALSRGLVLHGHLHRRVRRTLPTPLGKLDVVGATSASLLDPDPVKMAGYNVYDIDERGVASVEARIWDPTAGACVTRPFAGVSAPA
jgi:3',5'-cyclic AMP phosphodiesterase CpdA